MTEPLTWFAGRWAMERRLDDRRAGRACTVTGTADFTATDDDDVLAYAEVGTLTGDGQPSAAVERHLTLHDDGAPGVLVRFADGREYVRLELSGGYAEGVHHCAPDTYRITVRVDDDDAWTETWHVTGPAKDYTAVTRYRRRT
ncbi:DUF6314 family protein [Tersicoccus phoenicis]|nr:DUF6314 family protein [Tersicoccus phoenicis]